jgi:hypothetical protein
MTWTTGRWDNPDEELSKKGRKGCTQGKQEEEVGCVSWEEKMGYRGEEECGEPKSGYHETSHCGSLCGGLVEYMKKRGRPTETSGKDLAVPLREAVIPAFDPIPVTNWNAMSAQTREERVFAESVGRVSVPS